MRQSSIVVQISMALACMVALAITTMLTSYWLSGKADNDAQAMNIAGSLRVQSYTVGFLASQAQANAAETQQAVARLEQTWKHPIFNTLLHGNSEMQDHYEKAYRHWRDAQEQLLAGAPAEVVYPLLQQQVELLNQLVGSIQQHAESNASALRLVQVMALFLTLLLSAIVIYWLKVKVEQPLSELTQVAKRVGQGDFSYRIPVQQLDELGILGKALNRMSDAIAHMHDQMEEQIDSQTQALQRSNITLQFLYDTAKSIIEHEPKDTDYRRTVSRLAELVEADDIELCLMTEAGDSPYLQIKPERSATGPCITRNCDECLTGELKTECNTDDGVACRYSFPMLREHQHYGVLVCRMAPGKELDHWQHQLIQSVADQLAIALSLQAQEANARRLSLIHERTVIARELHDSLAQALSYLKIQVTRLNRAIDSDDKAMLEDVSGELKEGLNSAYRQLRELLTTFRLKVSELGLFNALQASVKQLSEQTDLEISLDYTLSNLPLAPNEEIHLLQIIREASQNAIHHSKGRHLNISLHEDSDKSVRLSIEDDGVGIPDTPEKLNHYGLAIMQERGKHLGGELNIQRRESGGTGVYFQFTPDYLQQRNIISRSAH